MSIFLMSNAEPPKTAKRSRWWMGKLIAAAPKKPGRTPTGWAAVIEANWETPGKRLAAEFIDP